MNRRSLFKGIASTAMVATIPIAPAIAKAAEVMPAATKFIFDVTFPLQEESRWNCIHGYDLNSCDTTRLEINASGELAQALQGILGHHSWTDKKGVTHEYYAGVDDMIDDTDLKKLLCAQIGRPDDWEMCTITSPNKAGMAYRYLNRFEEITRDASQPPAPDSEGTETLPALPDHDSTLAA